MTARVLVLGASGFIGRQLVRELASVPEVSVVAAYRGRRPADSPVPPMQLDATDAAAVAAAVRDSDVVVNCIAADARTMVESARILIDAMQRAAAPPRFIHMSSMAVYGSQTGLLPESTPLRADLGAYSQAKAEIEQMASGYPRAILLRAGCVYGPGSAQWSERVAQWLRAHRVGDLGANGDGYANLLFVADLIRVLALCVERPLGEGQAFNLAAAPYVTWNEYFTLFAKALGAVPLRRISARRLRLETKALAPGLKVAELVLAKLRMPRAAVPQPIPPSLARLWRQEIRLDVSKAERTFGLQWTPLAQGLAATARTLTPQGS